MEFNFRKNNSSLKTSEEVKRGRGRPPKNPQQQGPKPSNQIVHNQPSGERGQQLPTTKKWLYLLLIIILAAVPTAYFYSQNKDTEKKLAELKGSFSQKTDDTAELIEQVGKLVFLPTDEQPTIASVSDSEKLRGQAFFAQAQTGDKVLVYNKAKRAILYRPSINKIIEMAPLNSEIPQSEPQ